MHSKIARNEITANEILLLPYHVMRANAESAYLALTGEYCPFEGAHVADSFKLAELMYKNQGVEAIRLFPDEYIVRLNAQVKCFLFLTGIGSNVVLCALATRHIVDSGAVSNTSLYPLYTHESIRMTNLGLFTESEQSNDLQERNINIK